MSEAAEPKSEIPVAEDPAPGAIDPLTGTETQAGEVQGAPAGPERTPPKKRRLGRKEKRIIAGVVVVVVALIIGLWGMAPTSYLSVDDVVRNSGSYVDTNQTISVKGTVSGWDSSNTSPMIFNLTGSAGTSIRVIFHEVTPDAFENDKDVVVKGTVTKASDGSLLILAGDMDVGCASKYE